MATPTQSTPPNSSPPFLPPVELPSVQMWQPRKPQRKLAPWHRVALIAGVPIVAVLTAIGAYTSAQWAFGGSAIVTLATATPAHTAKETPRHTQPPAPAYNLAGYQAAISGTEEQSFVSALDRFRSDSRRYDFQAVTTDSLTLTGAANAWLAILKSTSPPPGYQASKLDYLLAATLARRAATTTQSGISAASLTSLQTGMSLASKAKAALARAAVAIPKGS
jgi:hypothetical protein